MLDLRFRLASKSDYDSLARLVSEDIAWNSYGIGYKEALQIINTAEDNSYVVDNSQEIVGFCAVRLNGVGNIGAYIRMMVVDWHYRGLGIGKQLINHVWDLVVKNVPNVFLICSTDNIKAQKFYEREGGNNMRIAIKEATT